MIYISPRVCLSALGQYITLSANGVFLDFHSIKIWIYSSTCPAVNHIYTHLWASQVVLVVKNLSVDAGNIRDTGLFNPWVKKIGEGNDYPVQYSWLENSRERGAQWAIVHRVAQSWTQLRQLSARARTHTHTHTQFSSVAQSFQIFVITWTAACQAFLASPALRVYSNLCSLSQWCQPTISSSVIPFYSCLQSFPASGSFPVSQFFTSGGQSIGVSAAASVLPINIQDWFPLGLTSFLHPCSPRSSQESSPTSQFKSINSSALSFHYSPTLTSIHDYWKNCSFYNLDLCWQSASLFFKTLLGLS